MAEKTPGSELSFEDRINEVLDKRLRDQTTLPAEFRSWLPRFIEIQNIQLPVSQVTGANLIGTDVDSLGGDVHGRVGMIRAGSTPYDFTQVTFDAVYDKWVSNAYQVCTQTSGSATTASTVYASVTGATTGIITHEAFHTAGLKPQLRLFAILATTNAASTATITLMLQPFSAVSLGTAVESTVFAEPTTSTGGEIVFKDWADLDGSVVTDDYLFISAVHKISNAAHNASSALINVWLRYVSV